LYLVNKFTIWNAPRLPLGAAPAFILRISQRY
jgi:hypothetical protein